MSKGAGREEGGRREEEGWRNGGGMEEGWRRGSRRVKVGIRELEGRKLGQGRREHRRTGRGGRGGSCPPNSGSLTTCIRAESRHYSGKTQ